MIKKYLALAKPGIIMGNLITAAGGFALASKGSINWNLFAMALLGLGFIVGSGCAFNNFIDRVMDQKMERTKNRPLATGAISERNAIIYGSVLLISGIAILGVFTNLLALGTALFGFFMYVVVYSFSKYRTSYATLIGSIAGAVPPVVGYTAASNHFDIAALLLFIIVALWQMPHFFAIAMYRYDEYLKAGIPVLPVKSGMHATKLQILFYTIAFIMAAFMLAIFGYTSYAYLIVPTLLGVIWLYLCLKGFSAPNDKVWAKQMFRYSLIVITAFSLLISF